MSKILKSGDWKFYRSVIDGDRFELEGLNIWDHQWTDFGQSVYVKDPIYGEDHVMGVYEISHNEITVKFAAGEFSNCVWGIYLPAIKM